MSKESWAGKLFDYLYGTPYAITRELALEIADQRVNDYYTHVNPLLAELSIHYDPKKRKRVDEYRRSKQPLRDIESLEYAKRIVKAYNRHVHTNYDALLAEGHTLERNNEIAPGEAKEYARKRMRPIC
jgi:hypothetical protein